MVKKRLKVESNNNVIIMKELNNEFINDFKNTCNQKLKLLVNKRSFEKEYMTKFCFRTKNSSDIKYKLIVEAEKLIDRNIGRKELKKYVYLDNVVYEIEKGLFEFSLISVTINKLELHFVSNIYFDKLYNLCVNLNMYNENINNQTLLPTILGNKFDPYFISFLSPEQLHPKHWSDIITKNRLRDETANNLQTTDIYKCGKCGERKFKITQLQMRSADEPVNTICTCMVCFNTFIK